jgi:hypothetical protein
MISRYDWPIWRYNCDMLCSVQSASWDWTNIWAPIIDHCRLYMSSIDIEDTLFVKYFAYDISMVIDFKSVAMYV